MNSKMETAKKILKERPAAIPDAIFRNLTKVGITKILQDKIYIRIAYALAVGKQLDLKNPKTFGEKLQWLKLYNRKETYTIMVDKFLVRQFVSNKIGEQYLVPLLGVWNNAKDINFEQLPNKYVLKCNHDSGGVVICKEKKINKKQIVSFLNRRLKKSGYWYGREWPYKNVKPCIIAEEYIENEGDQDLVDYKFFCFDGIPEYCQVISNRNTHETIDFFDMEWNHQEFTGLGVPIKPFSPVPIEKPKQFEKMKEIAAVLSENIPFVRVDLYSVQEKIYFGEMTFFPAAGFGKFEPEEWNLKMGEKIKLK